MPGLEPGTSSLPRKCSTAELHRPIIYEREEDASSTLLASNSLIYPTKRPPLIDCKYTHFSEYTKNRPVSQGAFLQISTSFRDHAHSSNADLA